MKKSYNAQQPNHMYVIDTIYFRPIFNKASVVKSVRYLLLRGIWVHEEQTKFTFYTYFKGMTKQNKAKNYISSVGRRMPAPTELYFHNNSLW